MRKYYWITRDGKNKIYSSLRVEDNYNIYIWKADTKPIFTKRKINKGMICSIDIFQFEKLYNFTPKKGSCELVEMDLSIKRKNKK